MVMDYADATQDRRVRAGNQLMAYSLLGLSTQRPDSGSPDPTWWVRDNAGTLVSQVKRDATTPAHYYLFDGLGSVVALTDQNGAVVARYDYDPYGKQISSEPTVANPWRYASGYLDTQTGLLKFGSRYYDPSVGRWTQQDPLGGSISSPRTLNRYAYVGNDPINHTDPTGLVFHHQQIGEFFTETIPEAVGSFVSECGEGISEAGFGIFSGVAIFSAPVELSAAVGALSHTAAGAATGGLAFLGLGTACAVGYLS